MYAADFLVDTQGWTATEVGIYTRLLMNEWVNGVLPEEMNRLARIGGVDLGNFLKCWRRVVGSKFGNNGHPGFVNFRLELEREKQDKYRELQSQKGKMGGRPQKSRSFSTDEAKQKPEESSSSSSSSSKDKKNKTSISHSETKIFLTFYADQFKQEFGTDPVIEWGKDGKIIKGLLKFIPLENLKDLLNRFFSSQDKFIQQSGYTIGVFKSQLNKLKIGQGTKDGMDLWLKVKEAQDERKGQKEICLVNEKTKSNLSGQPE